VCLCLGEMLHVLVVSLVGRLLGSRLALRGPDGSIIRATKKLAAALAQCTRRFVIGLQYFLLSVVVHALRGMHPAVSLVVVLIIGYYWRSQFKAVGKLNRDFALGDTGPVSTAFLQRAGQSSGNLLGRWDVNVATRGVRWWQVFPRTLQRFFNPAHHLHDLFHNVDDTDDQANAFEQQHAKPEEATINLIRRAEMTQGLSRRGQRSPLRRQLTRFATRTNFFARSPVRSTTVRFSATTDATSTTQSAAEAGAERSVRFASPPDIDVESGRSMSSAGSAARCTCPAEAVGAPSLLPGAPPAMPAEPGEAAAPPDRPVEQVLSWMKTHVPSFILGDGGVTGRPEDDQAFDRASFSLPARDLQVRMENL
jgi:hypothetical protein